jgi:hypothetical protein
LKLGKFCQAIRWKILIIFSLFSVVSAIAGACFSIAVLNVFIRRESAYPIEERIKVIVESRKSLMDPVLDRVQGCQYAFDSVLFTEFTEHLNATWPGSQSIVTILSTGDLHKGDPLWLDRSSFAGVVEDRGSAEIRFIRIVKREGCFVRILVRIPLGELFLNQLSSAAGLEIVNSKPVMLSPYRRDEGNCWRDRSQFHTRFVQTRSCGSRGKELGHRSIRKLGNLPNSSQLFTDDTSPQSYGVA